MNILCDPDAAFDAALRIRASGHASRPETSEDQLFLERLFAAVSPLRDLLPPALLAQQSAAANTHFRAAFPSAMRRMVTHGETPVGRIVIDWTQPDHIVGVDIAVLPGTGGIGLAMLRSWLAVADALVRPCRLNVVRTNPARAVYARLGFQEIEAELDSPLVEMIRPSSPARPSSRIYRC